MTSKLNIRQLGILSTKVISEKAPPRNRALAWKSMLKALSKVKLMSNTKTRILSLGHDLTSSDRDNKVG